jgi:hypothetical protein
MKTTITLDKAREIAGWWHGGGHTPLYAFSSTGTITEYIFSEVNECLENMTKRFINDPCPEHDRDLAWLYLLKEYLVENYYDLSIDG